MKVEKEYKIKRTVIVGGGVNGSTIIDNSTTEFTPIEDAKELPKVTASFSISLDCECPFCGETNDVFFDIDKEQLSQDFNATDLEVDVVCPNCGEDFIINETEY